MKVGRQAHSPSLQRIQSMSRVKSLQSSALEHSGAMQVGSLVLESMMTRFGASQQHWSVAVAEPEKVSRHLQVPLRHWM
jgi:hypothetical protein